MPLNKGFDVSIMMQNTRICIPIMKDKNVGINQLKEVIYKIRHSPDSRRIAMTAWNPVDIPRMALPPCHCFVQFCISNGKLPCQFIKEVSIWILPGELVYAMDDYMSVFEQIKCTPRPIPTSKIIGDVKDIDDFTIANSELVNHKP